jgi:hypothetical protein
MPPRHLMDLEPRGVIMLPAPLGAPRFLLGLYEGYLLFAYLVTDEDGQVRGT